MGQQYVTFVRASTEQLKQIVVDEVYVNTLFEHWYDAQLKMMNNWLSERADQALSSYQVTCLSFMVKVRVHFSFQHHFFIIFSYLFQERIILTKSA